MSDNAIQNKMSEAVKEPKLKICPECKQGNVIEKVGVYGVFNSCNRYPDCKFIVRREIETVGRPCPMCEDELVYRKSRQTNEKFVGCNNYPECKYSEKAA